MAEPVVDPVYEYEAPQFFDFVNVDSHQEGQPDAWFDGKPDDEGGKPILEDCETETDETDETDKVEEGQCEPIGPCPTEDAEARNKVVEQENSPKVEGKNDEDMKGVSGASDESEELSDAKPSDVNVFIDDNGSKCKIECSNDSLEETKSKNELTEANESSSEVDLKPEVNSKVVDKDEATKPKPSRLVTSWSHLPDKSKAKSIHTDTSSKSEKDEEHSRMVTRAQKRNNTLDISATSDIPMKKHKEIVEQKKEVKRPKRTRSLCSNPDKKPCLTFPVTPQCLKRQKTTKPTMIKLKTTEEMEMERIAKLRKQTKHHIKVNESTMKKAISSTSYHPIRTVVDPTKPQEFHFQTDKRVKPHPMTTRADDTEKEFLKSLRQHPPSPTWKHRGVTVPKPFNLSGSGQAKRKLAALDSDEKGADSYQSMAYQVYKFQTTTPPRFRTKKAHHGDDKTEVSKTAEKAVKITQPVTPNLSTSARARPVAEDVLSKEQQEEKEVEAMKSYNFKARPFDRRIIECEGLYGVKSIKDQKQLTEVVPFSFESDERLEAKKQEKPDIQEQRPPAPFKAGPQPNFEKVFRPQLKHSRTEPKPFSFEEKDKERWQQKESKIQNVYKEEEKLREFRAQPLPPDSPDTLPEVSSKCCTSFKPFALNTENRGTVKAEKWMQKVRTELQEERKKAQFHAKPNTVTHEAPFIPQKPQRPLLEVSEFALNTDRRAERREELNALKKEREMVDEELRKDRDEKRLNEEKKAIALLRKQLVHKAQPVLKFKEVVIKPSDTPLTAPQSPAWSEIKQRRMENIR